MWSRKGGADIGGGVAPAYAGGLISYAEVPPTVVGLCEAHHPGVQRVFSDSVGQPM